MGILESTYPKECNELREEFETHWLNEGYINGEKIGVCGFKDNELKYYKTDYKTMVFVYKFLRYKTELQDYVKNSSLGIHTVLRDKDNFIITQRYFDTGGNLENNFYQLTTSEGVEANDILECKDTKEDVIPYLIKRSLEEELGVYITSGKYKYVGYSEDDNRPYLLYEVVVEDVTDLINNKKQSGDEISGVIDIKNIYIVNKEGLYDTKGKEVTDSYKKYMTYLNT